MNSNVFFTSYILAAVAGICFVQALVVLSGGRRA